MDDTDRRLLAMFALATGAIGFGLLAGAGVQWLTGSSAASAGTAFLAAALVFGTAAVDTEESE